MKIVQLSTSDMGGAGIAAKQLHLALLNNSVDSTFVSKVKLGEEIKSHEVIETNSAFSDLPGYYLKNQKPGFEYFSFPYSETDLHQSKSVIDADIVNLHWIADRFTDYKNVFSLNKKFVWTLHDMNPFTGGCHHSDGCTKFEQSCNYCYQLEGTVNEYVSGKILTYKKEALAHLKDNQLVIVTPSKWLSDLSQRSAVFKRFKHVVIPNIVRLQEATVSKEGCRENLHVPKNDFVFLFVAHSVHNSRKGIHILKQALENITNKQNISLITIGDKSDLNFAGINTIELGFVTDKAILDAAYKAADAFLLPSLAENFPNTIVEALSSGTPVIASDVGGISEQITTSNGVLVEANNVAAWTKAITEMITNSNKFDAKTIANEAKEKYNHESILKKYQDVYKSILIE